MNTLPLTSLRFFAAIIVVIFHYGRDAGFTSIAPGLLTAGPEMVTFFFVLSGFVMAIAYCNAKEFSPRKYWINRFARIAPLYFVALFVSAYFYYGSEARNNIVGAALSATFLQSWVPPYPTTLNSPGWSLSVEAFFYLSFPAIIAIIRSKSPSPKQMIVVGIAVWGVTQMILLALLNSSFYTGKPSASFDIIYYFPASHWCSFFLGVCGGYWMLKREAGRHQVLPHILMWLSLAACYWILENKPTDSSLGGLLLPMESSLLAPVMLLLVCAIAQCKSAFTRILSARPMLILGEASFAMYILQNPVHYIFGRKIEPLLAATPNLAFLCYASLLIGISLIAFFMFEMPAKEYVRKLLGRTTPANVQADYPVSLLTIDAKQR